MQLRPSMGKDNQKKKPYLQTYQLQREAYECASNNFSAKDARVNGADLSKADLTVTPMY